MGNAKTPGPFDAAIRYLEVGQAIDGHKDHDAAIRILGAAAKVDKEKVKSVIGLCDVPYDDIQFTREDMPVISSIKALLESLPDAPQTDEPGKEGK